METVRNDRWQEKDMTTLSCMLMTKYNCPFYLELSLMYEGTVNCLFSPVGGGLLISSTLEAGLKRRRAK